MWWVWDEYPAVCEPSDEQKWLGQVRNYKENTSQVVCSAEVSNKEII
jgi:hypothetical protein